MQLDCANSIVGISILQIFGLLPTLKALNYFVPHTFVCLCHFLHFESLQHVGFVAPCVYDVGKSIGW